MKIRVASNLDMKENHILFTSTLIRILQQICLFYLSSEEAEEAEEADEAQFTLIISLNLKSLSLLSSAIPILLTSIEISRFFNL
jgi:hypothetical protein